MLPIYLLGEVGIGPAILFFGLCICLSLTIFSLCVAKERSQAVRTRPVFLDVDGRAFWRLNGYSEESDILVQGKV